MKTVYIHPKQANTIETLFEIPMKEGEYLYFIRLLNRRTREPTYKIGTTKNILRRMKEHLREYSFEYDIQILWISPSYSKFTTLRVEHKTKEKWKHMEGWQHIREDRFKIPSFIQEIKITVRKDYIIQI